MKYAFSLLLLACLALVMGGCDPGSTSQATPPLAPTTDSTPHGDGHRYPRASGDSRRHRCRELHDVAHLYRPCQIRGLVCGEYARAIKLETISCSVPMRMERCKTNTRSRRWTRRELASR